MEHESNPDSRRKRRVNIQTSGNHFSLSSEERAGVRTVVKTNFYPPGVFGGRHTV